MDQRHRDLINKVAFLNSSGLKGVFEKLCFRDGLVWMEKKSCVFKFLQRSLHGVSKFAELMPLSIN